MYWSPHFAVGGNMLNKIIFAVFIATLIYQQVSLAADPTTTTQQAAPNENDLSSHKHYTNSDGQIIHSPAKSKSGAVPNGATAQCGDGSYSFSQHHRGTCSHHGGVANWLN